MTPHDPPLMLLWIAKSVAIVSTGWVATTLMRNQRSALRHAIWCLVVAAHLVIPLSSFLPGPVLTVALPSVDARRIITSAPDTQTRPGAPAASRGSSPVAPATRLDLWRVLLWIWGAGAAVVFLRLLSGMIQIERIGRRSARIVDAGWLTELQHACNSLRITRPVTLIETPNLAFPVTWGFVYPRVLIPSSATGWDAPRRRHVLLHELGHIRRLDALSQIVAQIALALFWFQPLLWLAIRRLRAEAENACDDFVLRDGERPSAYATTLLEMARILDSGRVPALVSLSIGRSDFEQRVDALTRLGREAVAASRTRSIPILLLLSAIVVPLAAIQPTSRVGQPNVAAVSKTPVNAASALSCRAKLTDNTQFSETSGTLTFDDGNTVYYFFLRPEPGRCLEASFSLDTRFTDDDRDVAPTPGLKALVHETTASIDRAVYVEERNGRIERRFEVDGVDAVWDTRAEDWYRALMPEVIRRTSAGAGDRATRIVARGGMDALLSEISAIPSVDQRRDYLLTLLRLRSPEGLPREELISIARDRLDSYPPAFASFLSAVIQREGDRTEVRMAILQAIETLDHGADRVTVLETMTRHADHRVRIAALNNIGIAGDDSWRRTLLESSAPWFLGSSPSLVNAWFRAAETIAKPAARRELLQQIRTRELPVAVAERVSATLATY